MIIVDYFLWLVRYFLDILSFLLGYIFYPSKQRYLPPITNGLLLEPANKLASKIKSGKLKSEDLVCAYIDRCKEIHSDLNAVVDDNFEEALKEARQVDERVQRELRGEKLPNEASIQVYPFLGVPFTTKNSIAVKGKTYSGGICARKDVKADKDAVAIERMKKIGGAIFLAVTNIPELVMWIDSFNRVNGQTNNPYDKSRICGGSSGGEAALIGAAGSVFGVGSDVGGSIRIPSHFCGVFGHKTTPTIVSSEGVYPKSVTIESRQKMLSLGPICRYVSDVRPMLKVLAGDKLDLPDKPLNYSSTNVYYIRSINDPISSPVDVEIKQGLDKCLKHFIEKGSRTIELDTVNRFYDFRQAFLLFNATFYDKNAESNVQMLTENDPAGMNPYIEMVKCAFNLNPKYTAGQLLLAIANQFSLTNGSFQLEELTKTTNRLKSDLHEILGNNGVLLCPTWPEIACKHNETMFKFCNIVYTGLWNTMNVSITTVPLGLDRHGMPFSVQVIASPKNDNLTIQVAEELDKKFGGWIPPCPVQLKN